MLVYQRVWMVAVPKKIGWVVVRCVFRWSWWTNSGVFQPPISWWKVCGFPPLAHVRKTGKLDNNCTICTKLDTRFFFKSCIVLCRFVALPYIKHHQPQWPFRPKTSTTLSPEGGTSRNGSWMSWPGGRATGFLRKRCGREGMISTQCG